MHDPSGFESRLNVSPPFPSLAACDSSDPADATADAARDILKDKTLRCGIIGVMADCPPPNERTNASACILTGTGFAGVDPLDTRTLNAVADAPWGSYVGPLPTESVLGVTAFALQVRKQPGPALPLQERLHIPAATRTDQCPSPAPLAPQHVADQTGLNVEFYASRIPPAVLNNADSTQPYMYMLYDQGFDCAAYAVTFMYERAQFMRCVQIGRRHVPPLTSRSGAGEPLRPPTGQFLLPGAPQTTQRCWCSHSPPAALQPPWLASAQVLGAVLAVRLPGGDGEARLGSREVHGHYVDSLHAVHAQLLGGRRGFGGQTSWLPLTPRGSAWFIAPIRQPLTDWGRVTAGGILGALSCIPRLPWEEQGRRAGRRRGR